MIDYTSIETQIQRMQGKFEETYDIAEAKGAEIPVIKNIDNLPATVASIAGGEPNFLRVKMTQIIDGNTCEIQLETEETPNGFLGYIENGETQEINLIKEI